MRVSAVLCIFSLLGVGDAVPWRLHDSLGATSSIPYNQTIEYYHQQSLDHFDEQNNMVFSQRYFVIDDFWASPTAPVILHLCGEYTCPGINPARLFPLEMAQEHGARVVSVEHRFFGETQPFASDSAPLATEHLRFSSSKQAIADLAQFTTWFQQQQINEKHGLPKEHWNTWIVVGGSYPGALASWYRLKYPHLSAGSHSASGVVLAVLNFTAFDEQIAADAGPECAPKLRTIVAMLESNITRGRELLDAQQLAVEGDFFYLVADSFAEACQYGHRDTLCNALTATDKEELLQQYVTYVHSFFYSQMGASPADYDSAILADPVKGGNGRSWWWYKCAELGYWQVAPQNDLAVRSQWVNYTYHRDLCQRVFGRSELPEIDATNTYYGGNTTFAAHTFWDNGSQDPWRWAGVQRSLGPNNTANVMECDGCAHCQSLYTPKDSDNDAIKRDRDMLRDLYKQWVARGNGP